MNDFYFSKKMFDNQIKFATSKKYDVIRHEDSMFICEVLIDNEWKIFTEQLTTQHEPVTKYLGDLVFVGTQHEAQTRYTPIIEWLEKNPEAVK